MADAVSAADAGADYLGFIFYPASNRAIDVPTAKKIILQLRLSTPCPTLVGVFVDETGTHMASVLEECRLDLAQLSGDEVASLVGEEGSPLFGRCYKALRPTSFAEAEAEAEWYLPSKRLPHAPSLLIDSYHPTLRGGTGETGDWSLSARLAEQIPGLMLAGGLTAENVADAARIVRPFAVDVASGVEASPGIKDPTLMSAFIRNAKQL